MTVRLTLICLALAFFLSADQFSSDLQTKYGPPLHRQTFRIPAGEMVVDYSIDGRVCHIKLPATAPDKNHPNVRSKKAMDDFILELVPSKMRGKAVTHFVAAVGAPSFTTVVYENVSITETVVGELATDTSIQFKNVTCADGPAPAR